MRRSRPVGRRALLKGKSMRNAHASIIVSVLLVSAWLATVPLWANASDADRAIALAQRRLKRHAHDPTAYLSLGDSYIQKGP